MIHIPYYGHPDSFTIFTDAWLSLLVSYFLVVLIIALLMLYPILLSLICLSLRRRPQTFDSLPPRLCKQLARDVAENFQGALLIDTRSSIYHSSL